MNNDQELDKTAVWYIKPVTDTEAGAFYSGEELFWSNELGWCPIELADSYTDEERSLITTPDIGFWVKRNKTGEIS